MADISTLDGISEARNKLYLELEAGNIDEKIALVRERVLRGQTELKATVPLRMLAIVTKSKNVNIQTYGELLLKRIVKFTTGEEPPQIDNQSS